MNANVVALLAIVGIVALAVAFSAEKTGLAQYDLSPYDICPPGQTTRIHPVPGGGFQVVDCLQQGEAVQGFGTDFGTYGAHPSGDFRRQMIAQYGYETRYNPWEI